MPFLLFLLLLFWFTPVSNIHSSIYNSAHVIWSLILQEGIARQPVYLHSNRISFPGHWDSAKCAVRFRTLRAGLALVCCHKENQTFIGPVDAADFTDL